MTKLRALLGEPCGHGRWDDFMVSKKRGKTRKNLGFHGFKQQQKGIYSLYSRLMTAKLIEIPLGQRLDSRWISK